jgi:hypothetical protein
MKKRDRNRAKIFPALIFLRLSGPGLKFLRKWMSLA